MNKHGQVLVMFVILIPIIILLLLGIVETGNLLYKKSEVISLTKMIIANNIEEKSKDDIINIYKDNKVDVVSVSVIINNDINVKVTYNIPSTFGSLIGKEKYKVTLNLIGKKEGNKYIYKKG